MVDKDDRPRIGRPHSRPEDKKSKILKIYLKENEMYWIEQIAELRNCTKSRVMSNALNRYVGELLHSGYKITNLTKR